MTVERARVIKANADASATPIAGASAVATRVDLVARRLPRVVVDAHGEAERIMAGARERAAQLLVDAKAEARESAEGAAQEAREREIARVAADLLVARSREERRAERELDRTIELAVLLAERLVGEAIAVDPARVGALAVEALRETRGARQMRVEACPEDVPVLQEVLASLGEGVATVEPSRELARGSLVIHTELGRIDARLAPQLALLAESVREHLAGHVAADARSSRS